MSTLIRDGLITEDLWQLLPESGEGDAAPLPAEGRILLPLPRWLEERRNGLRAACGVWLQPDEDPLRLLPDLPTLPVIALRFPVFTDGRAYSQARLLRQRHGFAGELRAIGDVLPDQLSAMARCGFDAFVLRADQSPAAALAALSGGPRPTWPRVP
ncbi:DUF934 domain-containing protein [Zoogloea sp.]|uniref:DUF934 domain-containing protein n=1 Tax=Zoogloea sp. TaxID=49181 RepID=UPI001416DA8F|nr:MAG: DUF934 domain-containing protein [Zoogloea sp.]